MEDDTYNFVEQGLHTIQIGSIYPLNVNQTFWIGSKIFLNPIQIVRKNQTK